VVRHLAFRYRVFAESMRGLCAVTCALAAAFALPAPAAFAQNGALVHLDYEAHPACPSRAAFVSQVEARTNKARWTETADTAGARHFDVRLALADQETIGRLFIREPEGSTSTPREVRAATCESVVGALALITALAIDPDAMSATPAPAPRPKPPRPKPSLVRPRPRPAPVVPEPPEEAQWRWSVGAHVGATSGIGNKLAAVVPVFADITQYGNGWLEPSVRFGATILPDRTVVHEAGRADLLRFAGHVSACPVVARLSPAFVIRPCAGIELGILRAVGGDLDEAEESYTPWFAATVSGRLQLHPVDWALVEAQVEAGVPFVRPRYVVEPDIEVVRLDPAYGAFTGGLGVRFP
jgi:hypothetical protein